MIIMSIPRRSIEITLLSEYEQNHGVGKANPFGHRFAEAIGPVAKRGR